MKKLIIDVYVRCQTALEIPKIAKLRFTQLIAVYLRVLKTNLFEISRFVSYFY